MDQKSINKRLNTLSELKKELKKNIRLEEKLLKEFPEPKTSIAPEKNGKDNNLSDEKKTKNYIELRDQFADQNYFDKVKKIIKDIPESNGSKFFEKRDINIGVISDEFLYQSYKDVANFTYLTNQNYKEYKGKLDVFWIVTTWKGLNREWRGLANSASNRRKELYQMIDFFKKDNVKIVFYSKEDPVNYEKFIDIAKRSDYIFTTAKEKVNDYINECKNSKVFVLEFGVNPLYHNPVGMRKIKKFKDVFFAGSWLSKYPSRQVETKTIFDGVINAERDLKIIDRNFSIDHPDYFFPERYLKYISPAIQHEYLQKIHKLYDWAINLNSVKFSESMFANRIYELQAIGNIILSNYSVGVNNKFPNVFIINDKQEVKEIINNFTDEEILNHQIRGIRNVMSANTTFDRLDELLEKIGFNNKKLKEKKIAVVIDEYNNKLINSFESQTYKNKELFLKKDFDEETKKQFDMITFFDSDNAYNNYYLEDMINGFKYTSSNYITKDCYFHGEVLIEGKEHDYVDIMKDKSRTVFWSSAFELQELFEINGTKQIPNGYSIDRFEFINTPIEQKSKKENRSYDLSVIVPVYNNGRHLLNKCFNSLKRSSVFKDMEILLIDDGSTDEETKIIEQRLEEQYTNVKLFSFNDGGSGSASRPRNKGVELSTARYITYLDPDNEAVNDGYAHLLEILKNNSKLDMVIGNMLKLDNIKKGGFDYHKVVLNSIGSDVITQPREFLIDVNLRAQSIQALIVKRETIVENRLKMVEKAAGQDTLFFQELMLNSKKTKVLNLDIHIYYAAVEGSVTNTISKNFFNKYLTLEKERIPFLIKNNMLEAYMEKRFAFYFKNWYLKRLNRIEKKHLPESIDRLYNIYQLYEDHIKVMDKDIALFVKLYNNKKYEKMANEFK